MNSKTCDTPNPMHRASSMVSRDLEVSTLISLAAKYPMEALSVISYKNIRKELERRGMIKFVVAE